MSNIPGIGQCIYCGSSSILSNEHIIAYALGGTDILLQASCKKCSDVTSLIERRVLRRGKLWPLRRKLGLPSRRKHKDTPETIEYRPLISGESVSRTFQVSNAPLMMHLPKFEVPAFIDSAGYSHGIRLTGIFTYQFGNDFNEFAKEQRWKRVQLQDDLEPVMFARMLAKIGWAAAVACGAYRSINGEPFVLPPILGTKDDIGRWVGCITDPLETHPEHLHRVLIQSHTELDVLLATIQLFANAGTPRYGVILGRL